VYEQRIDQVRAKLERLRQADSTFALFGASRHRYALAPPWNPEDAIKFERTWQVTLPEEYKAFLLYVGSGGAGPYYGLERPENGVYTDLDTKDELNLIAEPFPYTEAWNLELDEDVGLLSQDERTEIETAYFSAKHSAGLLRISNFGCGVSINLVVNGPAYGEIWVDDRSNDNGLYPDHYFGNRERLTFLAWYEAWLDRSLEQIKEGAAADDELG